MILDEHRLLCRGVAGRTGRSKKFNGKFGWWQKLQLLWDCRVKPLTHCRALIMGVSNAHRVRRLHHAIILNIIINFLINHPRWNTATARSLSLEQWNKTLQDFGGEHYKVFRLYDRAI